MSVIALESRRLGHLRDIANALSGIERILWDTAFSGEGASEKEYRAFQALVDAMQGAVGGLGLIDDLGPFSNFVFPTIIVGGCATVASTIAGVTVRVGSGEGSGPSG